MPRLFSNTMPFIVGPALSFTLNRKHKPKAKKASETMFAGKRLKSYNKKELMEFLETYIKADN